MNRKTGLICAVVTVAAVAVVVPTAVHYNRGGAGNVTSANLTWVSRGCHLVDEHTATARVRYRGVTDGGSVSVGATIRLINVKNDATAGTATVRATVGGNFDVTLPVTVHYDEGAVTGDTQCYMSMARNGWHWPGH